MNYKCKYFIFKTFLGRTNIDQFMFTNYNTMCFREIRELFGISEEVSLCVKQLMHCLFATVRGTMSTRTSVRFMSSPHFGCIEQ